MGSGTTATSLPPSGNPWNLAIKFWGLGCPGPGAERRSRKLSVVKPAKPEPDSANAKENVVSGFVAGIPLATVPPLKSGPVIPARSKNPNCPGVLIPFKLKSALHPVGPVRVAPVTTLGTLKAKAVREEVILEVLVISIPMVPVDGV